MEKDPAITCSNPRLIAAIYYGLLSVVGTVLINAFLTSLGIEEKIPLFKAIILGMVVASCTGALFGEKIIHCPQPYKLKSFFLGFIMVIASIPIFDLGLVWFMMDEQAGITSIAQMQGVIYFYLFVLAYSYILFGIALAIASGIATMYLRGQLVYDILRTYEPEEEISIQDKNPIERNKIEHADKVSMTHK